MKKAGRIISYISAGILIFVSIVFIIIEARNLFSGDWLLFENQLNGFFRYLFRFIIALFVFAVALFTFFALRKSSTEIHRLYFYFGALSLLVVSNIISYFSSNYVDLVFRLVSGLYFVGAALLFSGFYYERRDTKTTNDNK